MVSKTDLGIVACKATTWFVMVWGVFLFVWLLLGFMVLVCVCLPL